MQAVKKRDAEKLLGKRIYALRKDGVMVTGKLVRIQGNQLIVVPTKNKKVKTSAFIPLVLFDLLAIGTYGGYGGGYGFGGPGYGYGGFGGPFFW